MTQEKVRGQHKQTDAPNKTSKNIQNMTDASDSQYNRRYISKTRSKNESCTPQPESSSYLLHRNIFEQFEEKLRNLDVLCLFRSSLKKFTTFTRTSTRSDARWRNVLLHAVPIELHQCLLVVRASRPCRNVLTFTRLGRTRVHPVACAPALDFGNPLMFHYPHRRSSECLDLLQKQQQKSWPAVANVEKKYVLRVATCKLDRTQVLPSLYN